MLQQFQQQNHQYEVQKRHSYFMKTAQEIPSQFNVNHPIGVIKYPFKETKKHTQSESKTSIYLGIYENESNTDENNLAIQQVY